MGDGVIGEGIIGAGISGGIEEGVEEAVERVIEEGIVFKGIIELVFVGKGVVVGGEGESRGGDKRG